MPFTVKYRNGTVRRFSSESGALNAVTDYGAVMLDADGTAVLHDDAPAELPQANDPTAEQAVNAFFEEARTPSLEESVVAAEPVSTEEPPFVAAEDVQSEDVTDAHVDQDGATAVSSQLDALTDDELIAALTDAGISLDGIDGREAAIAALTSKDTPAAGIVTS